VFSTLAKEFAVFDHWHAAVPSQTFCNRSFFHASTSNGYVTNSGGGYSKWFDPEHSDAPTIFNRLQDAGITWRVYYDADQLISMTGVLHATVTQQYWKTNFRTMQQFYADAAAGTLPAYSFIEPRMIFNHNDMHPPYGELRAGRNGEGGTVTNAAVSDVRAGEKLLHDVYTAVRASADPAGSNAMNTALIVTFDEHGGTYDHVAPPAAIPPEDGENGEMGFAFDRLGCRVPAILVSAFTARNTIVNETKHHASVIATLCRQYGLAPLTRRDETAPDIFDALNLTAGRPAVEWPLTSPADVPVDTDGELGPKAEPNKAKKLSNPAKGLLGLLIARFGDPAAPVPDSYEDAFDALIELGGGLFGTLD
jgi:phospholipase C